MIAILPMAGVTAIALVGAGMGFWEGFYFACFVAGLLLSIVSLVGGMGHIMGFTRRTCLMVLCTTGLGRRVVRAACRGGTRSRS